MSAPALIRASVLVLDASSDPLRDAALLVDDGIVRAAGPAAELAAAHPDADDLGQYDVVLPGLIDAHSHARGTPLREHGIVGGPLERFLVELPAMTPTDPRDEALIGASDTLATGVTATQAIVHSFGDPDAYGTAARATVEGLGDAGGRAHVAVAITDRHEWAPSDGGPQPMRGTTPARFTALGRELLGERHGDALIDAAGPVAPQWCSDAALAAVAEVGAMRVHAHTLESPRQRLAPGGDPLARLADAGLLDERTSLAHAVWLSPAQAQTLAARGAVAVHSPGSNELIEVGAMPARELLDAGVTLAFGFDSHTPATPPDAFAELRRARDLAASRGTTLTPRELLGMALSGGARALCRDDLGRLTPGARADAVALRLPQAAAPDADPLAAIVDHATRAAVKRVWVDGRTAYPRPAAVEQTLAMAHERVAEALAADAGARAARLAATAATWQAVDGVWRSLEDASGAHQRQDASTEQQG